MFLSVNLLQLRQLLTQRFFEYAMSSAAPPMKPSTVPAGIGTRITLAISTITVIGSTDEKASMIFP
jgi:hypothetical protein